MADTHAELGARCPSCNHVEPGGDSRKPCPVADCGYSPREATFFAPCDHVNGGACPSVYHHPAGVHFWTFECDQPMAVRLQVLEQRVAVLEDLRDRPAASR